MRIDERRDADREPAEGALYLMWDVDGRPAQARASLVNLSGGGLGFRMTRPLAPGTVFYCASPRPGLCSRAVVCHSERSWRGALVGARLLASMLPPV
jgi:hypothetical protein